MDENRLKDVPLFGGMSKRDRRALAKCADEIDIEAGKQLVREGDFAYEFFIIQAGTAEVSHEGQSLAELGPGDFFGEIGALEKVPRSASVTATSTMDLIVMTSQALRHLNRERPEVAQRLREAIDRRLPQTNAAPLAS